MKNKFLIVTTCCLAVLTGCNDFLDKNPDDRANPDSPSEISELLVSAYPSTSYYQFTELMSDNVSDIGNWLAEFYISKSVEEAYWWKEDTEESIDSPAAYWNSCYSAIATANAALDIIDRKPEKVQADYNAQRGEALLCRAYAHYMLVNIFSKQYDPATYMSAPGIPYVTKPEKVVFATYDRETVKQTYDRIQADLEEGLALIDDNSYKVRYYHFTKKAACAFASRFYQTICDWDNVIKYATISLGNDPGEYIRKWNTDYMHYSNEELQQNYTKYSDRANLMLCAQISRWGRCIGYRYNSTNDIRQSAFMLNNPVSGTFGYSFLKASGFDAEFILKFQEHFKKESINASYGLPYIMAPVFTAEEVILNRAEAYVMGNSDFASAEKDLCALISHRLISLSGVDRLPVTITSLDQNILRNFARNDKTVFDNFYSGSLSEEQIIYLKAILNMRRKEFFHEGMRWFDIRRFGLEVVHKSKDLKRVETLSKDDLRKVIQIPKQAITLGIPANAR